MLTEEQLKEENQKVMKKLYEMREADCRNKRNTGLMCNKDLCVYFATCDCIHPEKAFNGMFFKRK